MTHLLVLYVCVYMYIAIFIKLGTVCVYIYIYISRIQSYLLVKIALRFLSRIPKIYVDPRGIAQGVPP